ncbi:hypothetical protein GCK72_021083 [Caenorhabditis remanei]|uniref:F-box domain-containing protein n=1 Tax=Caenorhabditis remanei TaxID=31234 RepID=A0A6A5GH61_CAERE|nr:hypothetical protein GCK72_021083 [Caenorhabditis remanei]KAF1754520.1 hypothetical protein GCK72_021083 [Caenorhabditis remanei]
MTTPFPLLRLPSLSLIPVFQQMEPIDVIAFSFLSNRARFMSKTRGLSVTSIDIMAVNHFLVFDIVLGDDKRLQLFLHLIPENLSDFIRVSVDNKIVKWRNLGLSRAECIQRIMNVTNCASIQELKFCGTESFDALPILATLPNIEQIFISRDCNEVFVHKMFEMLSKLISNVEMFQNQLENLEQFQKVLMLNMNSITIKLMTPRDPTRLRLSLDDLLVCNAVHLDLFGVMISVKDLNRFFKLWKRNKSNPRLEHLKFLTLEEVSTDVLLKGLNVIEMPPTTTRTFRVYEDSRCREKVVTGGLDVMRLDGTRATLEVRDMTGITVVEFYVWI